MSIVWNPDALNGMRLGSCILEEPLNIGGMGAVFLARQERPHRLVGVKVIHRQLASDPEAWKLFLTRFQREADATAALDHTNIVPIYEFGEMGDMAYLVMPYLPDGSLATLIEQQRYLPLAKTVSYIEQVASALDYAHSQGIVHRDVKPSNMLLHADGRVLLADFGIARPLNLPDLMASASGSLLSDDTTLTQAGSSMGTPEFMAPEQVRGGNITPATDVYALGIATFEMLAGQTPFGGGDVTTVLRRQLVSPPPPVRTNRPDIPARVEEIIFWSLAKDPANRPNSAGEFAKALRSATRSRTLGGNMAGWLRQDTSPSAPLGPLAPITSKSSRTARDPGTDPRFPAPTMPLPQSTLRRSLSMTSMAPEATADAVVGAGAGADRTITVGANGVTVQPGWDDVDGPTHYNGAGGDGGVNGGAGTPYWPTPQPKSNRRLAIAAVVGLLLGIVAVILIAAIFVNTLQSAFNANPAGVPAGTTTGVHGKTTPSPLPTATRVPPTATPTPPTNWLTASPTSIALSCHSKRSATIRITNVGPESIDWVAQVQSSGGVGSGLTITPTSGRLDSEGSIRVTVSNAAVFFSHQGNILFSVTSGQQAGSPAVVSYTASACGGGG